MEPIRLSNEELDFVLARVTGDHGEYGAARICRLLAVNPLARTRHVNVECSVGNISDIVTKMVNPRIHSLGLFVGCVKPLRPFYNKFGQTTGEHLWSFYRDVAANDDDYDRLDDDINDLASKYPGLLSGERTVNDWERDLAGSLK
jgi:hypothetical protein